MGDSDRLSVRELDYLLAIFKKYVREGYARNKQIVEELKVSKSTASLMVKKLSRRGLVTETGRRLRLTDKGERVVAEKLWRHCVLENALHFLGTSVKDSCRISWKIEHVFPTEVLEEIWERLGRPLECPCGIKFPERTSSIRPAEFDVCTF